MTSALHISSSFDAGAIEVESIAHAGDIRLRIRADSHAEFRQWFHFRLQGAAGQACRLQFLNAGDCTYPDGWRGYEAVASYDRARWFRVPTTFDGSTMTVAFTPEHDSVWLAYFEPYSEDRHLALVATCQRSPLARLSHLGSTVEGRDMTAVTVGRPGDGKKTIWMIARQHPGETMAEWFCEGVLQRLTGTGMWGGDPVARRLLERAVFHIVPNMNPDGSAHGNLRTNAAGANLNREWMAPSLQASPEVYHVRRAIEATGCDMFFDIHGDEGLPYNFVAGSEMLPGFTEAQRAEQLRFIDAFKRATPDFQDVHGYAASKYNADALKLASKYIGHTFGCLSLTLEMPFKDNADHPDPAVGWNGARSALLGAAMLQAVLAQLD
ncbi:M14-type cytosolic carboxypeptidase [Cupriavidus basilensis]|uniref:M14-type cytosolic carboxypeptidase n=1 Tax=Cupriavidus basilensis TaxID=68895 RepID=A0ABT6B1U1_9BURK|nr:M14-type cytosolic carboxypeptidase [Cupriavidus basilensis]MDF3837896.1 M14-type cytosolic carboxypeptidase [Cupriavidus basilensis]